mmetsp:Transcript_44524/g.71320  ORF Transcript_44524/g.71320 Transcript_44524/m.71320 type:complete len:115 (+) Transcript_44524:145-489(+)
MKVATGLLVIALFTTGHADIPNPCKPITENTCPDGFTHYTVVNLNANICMDSTGGFSLNQTTVTVDGKTFDSTQLQAIPSCSDSGATNPPSKDNGSAKAVSLSAVVGVLTYLLL